MPALVRSANWNGAVSCSTASANCIANVLATTRRTVAPVTMPRTRPFGLRSAVRRPRAKASATGPGTSARAKASARWPKSSRASSSSRSTFRCSARVPDSPGAVPRRALRKAWSRRVRFSSSGRAGEKHATLGSRGASASRGRSAGSVSSSRVCWFPGASSAASSSCLARETSPILTRLQAVWRRRRASSSPAGRLFGWRGGGASARASASSALQCPARKRSARSFSSRAPSLPLLLVRRKSMRGVSSNTAQLAAEPVRACSLSDTA